MNAKEMPWWKKRNLTQDLQKAPAATTNWGNNKVINKDIVTMPYTEIQATETFDSQVPTPKVWDKETTKVSIGDYIRAPFTPIMQVIDKDVYPNGQTWLLVKPTSGSYTEEWTVEPEEDEESEFEQGKQHGKRDVAERLHPIYTQASCQYSTGYLAGYNGTQTLQQPKTAAAPPTWSVTYDENWQFYRVWVGNRAIGRASTHEKAERIGQKYIATRRLWQEHRERVLASYAD